MSAESSQVQVFFYDDVLDAGSMGASLAPALAASCGCAITTMLYRQGVISASAARRLRHASVQPYAPAALMLGSPLIVKLVGVLTGTALQLLQASLVPCGMGVGFIVISLVLNEIYVFDDVAFTPVKYLLHLLPFEPQSKLYSIEKRPEHAAVALKRAVHAQKQILHATATKVQPASATAVAVQKEVETNDVLTMTNVAMAVMFAFACRVYAWQAKKAKDAHFARLVHARAVPRPLSFHPIQAQPQWIKKQFLGQKIPLSDKRMAPQSGQRISDTIARLNSNKLTISPRQRWAIAVASLLALQLSHQPVHEGWLSQADVDE